MPRDWMLHVGTVIIVVGAAALLWGLGGLVIEARNLPPDPPAKPLQEWTFQDHKWVTFQANGGGGLAHHPDCPCRKEAPDE